MLDKPAILDALRIRPGQTILDAGCGSGHMSRTFSDALGSAGAVYAIDPDEEAIAALRSETAQNNIHAMVGDITARTPLDAACVDIVYIANVLHGFSPEQMAGFRSEVVRILKPGAKLAVVEIDKRETPSGPPMDIRFSPEDLRRAIPLTPTELVRAGEFLYMQVFEKKD
jgi:ubiquinone/menaquinone biosynthesis C-methylase UbiE